MPAIAGRRRRTATANATAVLQARVAPQVRTKAHETADALGVSMAVYIQRLIEHDELDERGRPTWWTEEYDAHQEELPLQHSA